LVERELCGAGVERREQLALGDVLAGLDRDL
jgi:hypothetical protein